MRVKHIVTSGCSFSDRNIGTWPHHLINKIDAVVHIDGLGSAGNSWIAKSAIHRAYLLLTSGVNPEDIIIMVMWSGIDRKDLFISSTGTPNYNDLISSMGSNPVNFIDQSEDVEYKSNRHDGYLVGTPHCYFANKHIQHIKQELAVHYFSDEAMAIESYENFLRLQWFCESKNINLVNMTFKDLLKYPYTDPSGVLTKTTYRNISPLYDMIDFSKWLFWQGSLGLYEYTRDNKLEFQSDGQHPAASSHLNYVDNVLMKYLIERNLL